MKKSIIYLLLISVISFNHFLPADAEEIGQVQTTAGVGFHEDSTDSSAPAESTTITTTKADETTKPKGRYPATGELVKKSIALSGAALILFALLFILWKRKKRKQTEKGKDR